MVYGREADGGYEPRVEVVGQVQREYRGHGSVARVCYCCVSECPCAYACSFRARAVRRVERTQ